MKIILFYSFNDYDNFISLYHKDEKIRKEMQLYIENALIELLNEDQKNKYFSLKNLFFASSEK